MKKKRIARVVVLVLFSSVFSLSGAFAESLVLEKAPDRRFSEEILASAYREALGGCVKVAMDTLEQSLRWDPYLVEYYLLKGYCLYLTGDLPRARDNIELYLEVRKDDPFASGFLRQVNDRKKLVEEGLEFGVSSSLFVDVPSGLWERLRIPLISKPALSLPGRPAITGDILTFCDTGSGGLQIFQRTQARGWVKYFDDIVEGNLVRAIPIDRERIFLVFNDGTVVQKMLAKSGLLEVSESIGTAVAISDACAVNSSLLAMADRISGEILFTEPSTGEVIGKWAPGEAVFEPVSVSSLGPLLAVADRMGKKVRVIDIHKMKELYSFEIPGPVRSIEWISSEKLVALTEEGELFGISIYGKEAELVGETFPEAWFLFRDGGEILVTDTRLFRSSAVSAISPRGIMVASEPGSDQNGLEENSFSVIATMIRPLGFRREQEILFQGVLGGKFLDAVINPLPGGAGNGRLRPLDGKNWDLWSSGSISGASGAYILDAADAPLDEESITRMGFFAVSRGLTINLVLGDRIPPLSLVRLAEITGGRTVISADNTGFLPGPEKWELRLQVDGRILMIGDVEDGGGLYLLGRSGPMLFEDRFPLWRVFVSSREKEKEPTEVPATQPLDG